MKTGKCIVLSAPSGSGKTTIAKYLLAQENLNLAFSVSATSRPPRGQEVDGKDYYFLSEAAFKAKITEGAFTEYEEVYPGMFYGTLKSELDRIWALDKNVLFDIDVIGGLNIKNQFPKNTLSIFIKLPSTEALAERLRQRDTDSSDKIAMRLEKANFEMVRANAFDVVVVNDNLETAISETVEHISNFLTR
ncbi:MAG: guanylate kinase [Flavobacteriaceae bacterium]|nr:guanylate kinase [Flavobacteriaceae bacterium]|tara:strand:+ start:344 stop:916 length:573 start_codon:yes stop_codon:yes gene_type:complete